MAFQLDSSRSALLCMDFQRDIIADSQLAPTDEASRLRFTAVVDRTAALLDRARASALRIIHVRVAFSPGYPEASRHAPMAQYMKSQGVLLENAPGTRIDERVAPLPGEEVVTKRGVSAFVGTELDRLLRIHDIETVIATGLVTHYVVEGTARHASDLGYRVLVVSDCCTSGSLDRHQMSLRNLGPLAEIVEADQLTAALEG